MIDQPSTNRIDVSSAVDALLIAAAPERATELKDLWGQHFNRVHLIDKPEFDIGAWFGVVQTTQVTLEQIWLLGFAAWRAIQAYSGIIWLLDYCHAPFERDKIAAAHGQKDADADFDNLLRVVQQYREPGRSSAIPWPSTIPQPTAMNDFFDVQERAAYELTCISGAFIFLHEVRHVKFASDGDAPTQSIDEESACDLFARNFLMESVNRYASASGQDAGMIKAKRALGIMVAKMLMLEIAPLEKWSSGDDHPPVGDRLRAFLDDVPNDASDHFWLAASSLLGAMCRSRNRLPERISFNGCKELTNQLAALV